MKTMPGKHHLDPAWAIQTLPGDDGEERHPFNAGDLLFVPAGVVHRFEDFSDDFSTWVIFYGPEGGE